MRQHGPRPINRVAESVGLTIQDLWRRPEGIGTVQKLELKLDRYLRHVHTGDYSLLPQIWPLLFAHLKERNEVPRYPNLEIYGHWNAEPSKCETTILIGLDQK